MSDAMDPDALEGARRAAAAMYADDRASRALGIVIDGVAPGRATARLRVSAEMVNGHGIAHGGYIFLLADTAFAFACNTYAPTVAAAAEITFVRTAAAGDELAAEAAERVRFGEAAVYDVTVRNQAGDVVAEFRGHSRRLRSRSK